MKTTSEFMTCLFEIEVNAHIAHLQTTSFAQHSALDELYKRISDLRDSFAEAYQGQYGIMKGYKNVEVQEGVNMVDYITKKCAEIKEYIIMLTEGYLQQLVDNILEFLYSVEYKLKNLR